MSKAIYWFSTVLLTLLMLFSVGNYIFNYTTFSHIFNKLGYPTDLIYLLSVAKIMGLFAIWSNKSKTLLEWAYAGFFFDFILAIIAHIRIDGGFIPALIAIALLFTSYFSGKVVNNSKITVS